MKDQLLAEFEIPGSPLAQPRPRGYNAGGFVKMYVPKLKGEKEIAAHFKSAREENYEGFVLPFGFEEEPLCIEMLFYGPHGGRDLDNIAKLYLDHMVREGIISEDKWKIVRRLECEAFPAEHASVEKRTIIRIWAY